MVAIDSNFLSLLLHPKARAPIDPGTKNPIHRLSDRIEKLIEDWENDQERIIIPTPVLSEFLVLAGSEASAYLDEINVRRMFLVKPFDAMAAIELAAVEVEDRQAGDKRAGVSAPWQKVRFDRQIVAIAKSNGATRIYSDDKNVRTFAIRIGLEAISTWELPQPAAKQANMFEGQESHDVDQGKPENH